MEIGSTKPGTLPNVSAPARADVTASFKSVPTELPPNASVQQAAPTEVARFEPSEGFAERAAIDAAVRSMVRQTFDVDPRTKDVVAKVVDSQTGEVVSQSPNEALLRLRAYLRAADDGQDQPAKLKAIT